MVVIDGRKISFIQFFFHYRGFYDTGWLGYIEMKQDHLALIKNTLDKTLTVLVLFCFAVVLGVTIKLILLNPQKDCNQLQLLNLIKKIFCYFKLI